MGSIRRLKRRNARGSGGGSGQPPANLLEALAAMRGESLLDVVNALAVGFEADTRLPSPDAPSVPWETVMRVLEQLPTIDELRGRPSRVHVRFKTAEAVDLLAFTCDPLGGAFNALGTLLFPWEDPDGRPAFPFALVDVRGKACAMTLDDFEGLVTDGGRHIFFLTIIEAELEP